MSHGVQSHFCGSGASSTSLRKRRLPHSWPDDPHHLYQRRPAAIGSNTGIIWGLEAVDVSVRLAGPVRMSYAVKRPRPHLGVDRSLNLFSLAQVGFWRWVVSGDLCGLCALLIEGRVGLLGAVRGVDCHTAAGPHRFCR